MLPWRSGMNILHPAVRVSWGGVVAVILKRSIYWRIFHIIATVQDSRNFFDLVLATGEFLQPLYEYV